MYKNKLVACIKAAGKVLREQKDSDGNTNTYIPFGSEYSIFIKNLNTVRASVSIQIDGQDALGTSLVVAPNSEIDLERFIKNGNFNAGNRFKFIERNAKVEQARGIQAEDGLIRIEFQFEKAAPEVKEIIEKYKIVKEYESWYGPKWPYPYYKPYWHSDTFYGSCNNIQQQGVMRSLGMGVASGTAIGSANSAAPLSNSTPAATSFTSTAICGGQNGVSSTSYTVEANHGEHPAVNFMQVGEFQPLNDAGITVAGSVSEQKFTTSAWFALEDTKHVVVLKLLGETVKGKVVKQAVTVKAKQKCSTCNHVNKATAKFCSECGTALEIV